MKSLLLLFIALPLVAQEPAPAPEKKEPELPAKAAAPSDDKLLELLRKNPTPEGRTVQPAKPEAKTDAFGLKKPAADQTPRLKDRTTLLPPTTSTDLDLRIRYRKARTFAEQTPAAARST